MNCLGCGNPVGDDLPGFAQCLHCSTLGTFCDKCHADPVCSGCRSKFYDPTIPFRKQPIKPVMVCSPTKVEPGTLYIALTCDWEGRENIHQYYSDMMGLRKEINARFGVDVPITHFVTPRSYEATLMKVISAGTGVLPCDEIGLHIHCWNDLLKECDAKLLQEAKVVHKKHPDTASDGKDTPLVEFSPQAIRAIVAYCHHKLHQISGVQAVSFRGGAWYCSDAVYDALARVGVTIDSSPIPLALIDYPYQPGEDLMKGLWGAQKENFGNALTAAKVTGAITVETQPYKVTAPSGDLKVFPMTWGMDVNAPLGSFPGWLMSETQKVVAGADRFVNFGFHDTLITRKDFVLPVLKILFDGLNETTIGNSKFKFRFVTMQQAAAAAKV